jgi:hypothetical protein
MIVRLLLYSKNGPAGSNKTMSASLGGVFLLLRPSTQQTFNLSWLLPSKLSPRLV